MSQGTRITAIIAAYNEEDIIGQTVEDLVLQGIHVHLLDHCSSDGTVAAVQPYVDAGHVQVERFPAALGSQTADRFALEAIIARKEQLARELDADWFINHDADEFRESPWSHLNFREGVELVDRSGYNAIDFAVLNFWPTSERIDLSVDIRQTLPYFEYGAPWDRVQIRCWKKIASVELMSSAGHAAQFEGRRVFPLRFLLRHYPIRGQAHGMRKVFHERKPRFAPEERKKGWHVQYDAVDENHNFVRDPATLRHFDPDDVRVELQIQHRGIEALHEQVESLSAEREEIRQRCSGLMEEIEVLRGDLETVRRLLDAAQGEMRQTIAQLDGVTAENHLLNASLDSVRGELDAVFARMSAENHLLSASLDSVRGQLDAVFASKSWRVTAPLRALQRALARS